MGGNGYQRGTVPKFWKLPLGFSGIFLGFDSKSYAYIRHPENEIAMEQDYNSMKIEIEKFYASNQNLTKLLTNDKVCLGDLYAYEGKPKSFSRVQIICVSKNIGVILAVNVDTGKVHEIEVAQLYLPVKIFFKLPFQVIRCKLFGLESFLGTQVLEAVWKKMNTRHKHYKMTIIKTEVVSSVLFLEEDSTISVNSVILKEIGKYNEIPEPHKEKETTPTLNGFFCQDTSAKPSYPGSKIEFFPNNLF